MDKVLLIIEDEYCIAMSISMALQKLGYIIFTSSSSKKALEVLKSTKIDLILMNISIDNAIDGFYICELIQKDYNLPIIFLTSYKEEDFAERLKDIVYYGFIDKTSPVDVLDKKIKEALDEFSNN